MEITTKSPEQMNYEEWWSTFPQQARDTFNAGRTSFIEGMKAEDNPFDCFSNDGLCWFDGFNSQKEAGL